MKGNNDPPLVSVIVPVYNVEAYLDACVQSVLKQTCGNWELILVDDGSTDRSGAVCDLYREKDSRVTVCHTANHGVSHARNVGLDLAVGKWISFLDSDDFFFPRALEVYLRYSDGVDVVVSACRCFPQMRSFPSLSAMGSDFIPFFFSDFTVCWKKLFRRERLTVRFNEDLRRYEDVYFFFEQMSRCRGIRAIPDILYFHRKDHMDSLTHHFSLQGIKAGKDMYQYLLSVFPDSPELHHFGMRFFVADYTCDCIVDLFGIHSIDPQIKLVLLEELLNDPVYADAGKNGITPYADYHSAIWDMVLRHDAAAALECARELMNMRSVPDPRKDWAGGNE